MRTHATGYTDLVIFPLHCIGEVTGLSWFGLIDCKEWFEMSLEGWTNYNKIQIYNSQMNAYAILKNVRFRFKSLICIAYRTYLD